MGTIITPLVTVDIIIEITDSSGDTKIILIKRKNPPFGWALPGGFVDVGETLESAAIREAREETGLDISEVRQFHAYSDPARDVRGHTVSMVFIAKANGVPVGQDDAAEAKVFSPNEIPPDMAFDHGEILRDYVKRKF